MTEFSERDLKGSCRYCTGRIEKDNAKPLLGQPTAKEKVVFWPRHVAPLRQAQLQVPYATEVPALSAVPVYAMCNTHTTAHPSLTE
jgi:hypothetical protein